MVVVGELAATGLSEEPKCHFGKEESEVCHLSMVR